MSESRAVDCSGGDAGDFWAQSGGGVEEDFLREGFRQAAESGFCRGVGGVACQGEVSEDGGRQD